MGLEITVYCNECGAILAASRVNARIARAEARTIGARTALPGGQDLCKDCAGKDQQ